MSETNGVAVLERVRAALDEARAAGRPAPGRPTLAKLTGASEHQVRQALNKLETPPTNRAPTRAKPTPPPVVPPPPVTTKVVKPPQAGDETVSQAGDETVSQPVRQPGARLVAWVGFVFGSVMSTAANVLYTWLPATTSPEGWTPGIAPQVGAAVWPIALLLSVEVLSRVTWRSGWLWGLARYGGAGLVAVGSAIISYGHLREVLLAWGYGQPESNVGPLVLDGLMVVCGFALLAMSGHQAGDRR